MSTSQPRLVAAKYPRRSRGGAAASFDFTPSPPVRPRIGSTPAGTVLHSEWRVSRVAIADVADASADAPDDTEGLVSPPKLFLLVLAFSIAVVVGAGLYARARHEGRQPRVCASRPLGEPRSPPPSPMAIRTKSRSSTDSESGL